MHLAVSIYLKRDWVIRNCFKHICSRARYFYARIKCVYAHERPYKNILQDPNAQAQNIWAICPFENYRISVESRKRPSWFLACDHEMDYSYCSTRLEISEVLFPTKFLKYFSEGLHPFGDFTRLLISWRKFGHMSGVVVSSTEPTLETYIWQGTLTSFAAKSTQSLCQSFCEYRSFITVRILALTCKSACSASRRMTLWDFVSRWSTAVLPEEYVEEQRKGLCCPPLMSCSQCCTTAPESRK